MVNPGDSRQAPAKDVHDDRRKHRRVEAPLKARFLNEAGKEQPCLVANISAGGALLKAKHAPAFGERVVLYIDGVGRFEGDVIRSTGAVFAVNYEKKREKNARTADALTEMMHTGRRTHDRRAAPRIRQNAPARVFFEDGRAEDCAILDISLTGASIEISPRPPLGARLILGRMNAKVVRRHEKGVGVVFTRTTQQFDEAIDEAQATETVEPAGAQVAKPFGKKQR